jgi:hypothetical protein
MILGSLTRELSQEEVVSVLSRTQQGDSGQSLAAIVSVAIDPETLQRIFVEMWLSDRGLKLAERVAYEQLTMVERLQTLVQLPAATLMRIRGFGGEFSRDQEAAVWDVTRSLFEGIARTGRIKLPHIAKLGMAWKGSTNFLDWEGVASQLDPELRAGFAWILGHRSLQLDSSANAKMYFETAFSDTQSSSLRELTKLDLADLKNGVGRIEVRNETEKPVTIRLNSEGNATVVVEAPANDVVTAALTPALWKASLAPPVDEESLTITKVRISAGNITSTSINDAWSPGDSESVLPGIVRLPSEKLGIGRYPKMETLTQAT